MFSSKFLRKFDLKIERGDAVILFQEKLDCFTPQKARGVRNDELPNTMIALTCHPFFLSINCFFRSPGADGYGIVFVLFFAGYSHGIIFCIAGVFHVRLDKP